MNLALRHDVMAATDPNTIYVARDLVCDGTNWYDTGFAPFSTENANTDFRIAIRFSTFETVPGSNNQETLVSCKYEGTIGGQQWPGFLARKNNASGQMQIGGFNYWQPNVSQVMGHTLFIWRKAGVWYGQYDGSARQTLSVRVATFDQHVIIGSAEQTSGTKFRFCKANIDYARLDLLR